MRISTVLARTEVSLRHFIVGAVVIACVTTCSAQSVLTDQGILDMYTAKVPSEAIIAAIRSAKRVSFSMLPAHLESLVKYGVPDEIIREMALRMNPSQVPAAQPSTGQLRGNSAAAVQPALALSAGTPTRIRRSSGNAVEVPEGQRVRVRLEQQLSSATADEGQPVQLTVTEDVRVRDIAVFAQGATVTGTVITALPKRRMGRTGKLDFSIDRAIAVDGSSVPLRYTMVKKEGGSHAVRTGVITAGVAVLFWPAAPFVLLAKGKDTVINKGMVFEVFTDAVHAVDVGAVEVE